MVENQVEFEILGETEQYLAVAKPPGLLVHPTKPDGPRTLWDGLRELLGYELATGGQVSLVNRLDRETSGIVLVAKSAAAARATGKMMQTGGFRKEYLALVFGWPEWTELEVDAPLLRLGEVAESAVWLKRAVHETGAPSYTKFAVVSQHIRADGQRFSLVRAVPLTGRTHQIRVHLAHAGHPVVGDKIYGKSDQHYLSFIRDGWTPELERELWLPRQALHATRLSFKLDDAGYDWTCPLPADLAELVDHSNGRTR